MIHNNYEFIHFDKIKHVKIFINQITYCSMHVHSAWEFGFVMSGISTVKTREETFTCKQNDIILFEPFHFHEIYTNESSPTLFAFIQISPHFCQEYFHDFHCAHFHTQNLSECITDEVRRQIINLIVCLCLDFFMRISLYRIHCLEYLCKIVEAFLKNIPNTPYPPQDRKKNHDRDLRIQRITDYIESHYLEPNILNKIAEQEQISVSYLSTFFHKYFNMSFQEYIRILRFDKALRLFPTEKSLMEICGETGFSSVRYLNNCCIKEFGMSASAYRNAKWDHTHSEKVQGALHPEDIVHVYDRETAIAILQRLYAENEQAQ